MIGQHQRSAVEILVPLGGGGMAEVYLGRAKGDTGFEKLVAVKQLLPHIAMNTSYIEMLVDEARVAANLTHSNIGQVYDLRRDGDAYYIIMEYIHGVSLHQVIRAFRIAGTPAPAPMVAYIMSGLCAGLAYAHNKRDQLGRPLHIIHRDVSPDNVMVSYEGEIKLIDFGIVKATPRLHETVGAKIKGKPIYMSPEQASGDPLDHRSDIYSAGLVLYEMLCHSNPLAALEAIYDQILAAAHPRFPPPSTIAPGADPELERICIKALERDPQQRFSDAGLMEQDLGAYLQEHPYQRQQLASWMKQTFEAERTARQQAISGVEQGAVVDTPPRTARVGLPSGYSNALRVIQTESALTSVEDLPTVVNRMHPLLTAEDSPTVLEPGVEQATVVDRRGIADPRPARLNQATTVLLGRSHDQPQHDQPQHTRPQHIQPQHTREQTRERGKGPRTFLVQLGGSVLVVALALVLFLWIQHPEPIPHSEPRTVVDASASGVVVKPLDSAVAATRSDLPPSAPEAIVSDSAVQPRRGAAEAKPVRVRRLRRPLRRRQAGAKQRKVGTKVETKGPERLPFDKI